MKMFKPYGDLATFVALGAVIIVFGIKTRDTNRNRLEKLRAEKAQAIEYNKQLVNLNNEMRTSELIRKSAVKVTKIAEKINTKKPSDE